MKIRTDFVTNSSSSSFIIALDDDKIKFPEDLKIHRIYADSFHEYIEALFDKVYYCGDTKKFKEKDFCNILRKLDTFNDFQLKIAWLISHDYLQEVLDFNDCIEAIENGKYVYSTGIVSEDLLYDINFYDFIEKNNIEILNQSDY